VEAYASGHALDAVARARGVPLDEALTHPAMDGFLTGYVRDLAFAIASAVNILDPDVVVIGGGLHGRTGFPREALAAAVHERLRGPRPREHVRIVPAALGSEAVYAGGLHVLAPRLGGAAS
jgi:predicted NBD/HSP70 family sugar kinase